MELNVIELRQLLNSQECVLGRESSEVADTLTKLSELYLGSEDYADAEICLLRALDIKTRIHGVIHDDIIEMLDELSGQYRKRQQLMDLWKRSAKQKQEELSAENAGSASHLGDASSPGDSHGEKGTRRTGNELEWTLVESEALSETSMDSEGGLVSPPESLPASDIDEAASIGTMESDEDDHNSIPALIPLHGANASNSGKTFNESADLSFDAGSKQTSASAGGSMAFAVVSPYSGLALVSSSSEVQCGSFAKAVDTIAENLVSESKANGEDNGGASVGALGANPFNPESTIGKGDRNGATVHAIVAAPKSESTNQASEAASGRVAESASKSAGTQSNSSSARQTKAPEPIFSIFSYMPKGAKERPQPSRLVIEESGEKFSLRQDSIRHDLIWIGKERVNDIRLANDDSVEWSHAVIKREGNEYWLMNRAKRHDTILNSSEVSDKARISPGDCILIGHTHIWVE